MSGEPIAPTPTAGSAGSVFFDQHCASDRCKTRKASRKANLTIATDTFGGSTIFCSGTLQYISNGNKSYSFSTPSQAPLQLPKAEAQGVACTTTQDSAHDAA